MELDSSISLISIKCLKDPYLVVDCIELVVKAHCEICACIRSNMSRERALNLIHCIVHINSSLADLHILKAGFHTETE